MQPAPYLHPEDKHFPIESSNRTCSRNPVRIFAELGQKTRWTGRFLRWVDVLDHQKAVALLKQGQRRNAFGVDLEKTDLLIGVDEAFSANEAAISTELDCENRLLVRKQFEVTQIIIEIVLDLGGKVGGHNLIIFCLQNALEGKSKYFGSLWATGKLIYKVIRKQCLDQNFINFWSSIRGGYLCWIKPEFSTCNKGHFFERIKFESYDHKMNPRRYILWYIHNCLTCWPRKCIVCLTWSKCVWNSVILLKSRGLGN